ncbi:MAG: phosphodiester glycosidase family protein [Oscillospiraceae bacterium]|nr:phosphodiester glycosidase family protein [Oscillospiraceae bacterium]
MSKKNKEAELAAILDELPELSEQSAPVGAEKRSFKRALAKFIRRALAVLLVTLLLVLAGLYGVMYILTKGPSPTARDRFVMSVRETSAIGFLANLYLSDEEIAEIEAGRNVEVFEETDSSLITIGAESESDADAWGFVDDDGDGIIIDEVKGEGYSGYMMIILDPSRVIMGCVPETFFGRGYTVEEMVQRFDAVAGINAGGFEDKNGQGNGSEPDSAVVFKGELYLGPKGTGNGFVGFDDQYILHVGLVGSKAVREANIQYGCSFGPVLVHTGEGVNPSQLASGINPRTAIGQRSDGAVLMLVIDGRQVISLGATYEDLMEIMLRYGAVNACNLDGGSSSLMYYNGAYVNNCASVIGIRPVPDAFIVLKEGARERDGY